MRSTCRDHIPNPFRRGSEIDSRVGVGQHFEIFLSGPGVENHDLVLGADAAIVTELLQAIQTDRRLGTERNPFRGAGVSHPFADSMFVPSQGDASTLTYRVEDHEIPDCDRYSQSTRDGLGVRKWRRESFVGFEGSGDRRTSLTLTGDHSRHRLI